MCHWTTTHRLAVACLLLFAAASPVRAEWFADLYGGVAYTPHSDIIMMIGSPTGPADHTFHNVEWDPSGAFGARAGYWFDSVPWYGVGLDVFRFKADVPTQTVNLTISGVTAPATLRAIDFSADVMALDLVRVRYGFLASPGYAKGRAQAYATAGPAIFRIKVTNKENGELTNAPATDTTTGYKAGAGLSWQLNTTAALFGEYRFTHVHSEPALAGTITGARVPTKFDLDTHHLVAGVSFRF
jgi:opacity protein-like surface antigen